MRAVIKIILVFLLITGLCIYWFLSKLTDAFSPTYRKVELVSSHNQKLYIKSMNWGVTDDSQLTLITTPDNDDDFKVDSTRQIIFEGLEPFLYKASNDTLFLVLREKIKIPNGFKSQWTIIQKEVDNPTMISSKRNFELKGI